MHGLFNNVFKTTTVKNDICGIKWTITPANRKTPYGYPLINNVKQFNVRLVVNITLDLHWKAINCNV